MKICRACQSLNDNQKEICWNCGTDLSTAPEYIPVIVVPNPAKDRQKDALTLFIVGAVLASIIIMPAILSGFTLNSGAYSLDAEPNNGFDTASRISGYGMEEVVGFLNGKNDPMDFYTFFNQHDGKKYINLTSSGSLKEMSLRLYDPSKNLIAEGKEVKEEDMTLLTLNYTTDLYPKDFLYIRVEIKSGWCEYWLKIEGGQSIQYTDDSIFDPGNSFLNPLWGDNRSYKTEGRLSSISSPLKIYAVNLTTDYSLSAEVRWNSDMELNITLYNPEKDPVADSFPQGEGAADLTFRPSVNDTYFIILRAYEGEGMYSLNYTLKKEENRTVPQKEANNASRTGRKIAFLIGISDYIDSGINDLEFCDSDAEDWGAYLGGKGYEVHILTDHEATKGKIISELGKIERELGRNDTFIFVFSGHGFNDNSRTFISPADTDKWFDDKDISDVLLYAMFLTLRSRETMVFLDTCSSGGMSEVAETGSFFIASSRADENSIDSSKYSNGLWTHYFLEIGLEENGEDSAEIAFQMVASPYTTEAVEEFYTSCHPVMIDNDKEAEFLI